MQTKLTKDKKYMIKTIILFLKYMFALVITLMAVYSIKEYKYLIVSLSELVIIGLISNFILKKKKLTGYIVNSLLLLLYNTQMSFLYYANSYITYLMVSNVDSMAALSGRASVYIGRLILVCIFSFLPAVYIKINKKTGISFASAAVLVELAVYFLVNSTFSPMFGYCAVAIDKIKIVQQEKIIEEYLKNGEVIAQELYKEEITDYIAKNVDLPENPNIILIFTEGLSQNIIDDEREIMPNMAEYQSKSLNFTNYFNHTFATFRGLIGQLYSGFQLNDYDTNSLVSIQSVLSDQGYNTVFINSEPTHPEFTEYINSMGFDSVLGKKTDLRRGDAGSIADKDLYEMLFETAEAEAASGKPFFLSTYSFGTHASLNGIDEKYGDGSSSELNKFYDVDYQFGKFMEKYEESDWAKNTIVIMTTDHATYEDDEFNEAFPEYERNVVTLDRIPLFIFYPGITPEDIDVKGRNTLCLAPTILDYLDISAGNYFMGTSLFAKKAGNICEYFHSYPTEYFRSKNGEVTFVEEQLLEKYKKIVQNYYITNEVIAAKTDENN